MSLKDPNRLNAKAKKRVAIVIANPAISSVTNWHVGFWWSETARLVAEPRLSR